MKLGVVFAVLLIGLAQQPTKPTNGSGTATRSASSVASQGSVSKKNEHPSANTPATSGKTLAATDPAPTDSQPGSKATNSKPTNEDLVIRARLPWFIAALALVAALQLIVLLWQGIALGKMFRSLRYQANETEQQRILIEGQTRIMGEQLTAVKDLAAAANSTSQAVKETVNLLTSRERARLRVEVEPFYLNLDASSPVIYTIHHEGLTDAFILDSRAATFVSNSREPGPIASPGSQMAIPSIITPQMGVVEAQDSLYALTGEEIESVKQLNSFVHFTAYIKYRDIFDAEHEIRMHRVWNVARMNHLGGEPFTYWESVA